MTKNPELTVRRPVQTDRSAWGDLYAAYADFYAVTQTEDMRDRVWSWLHDPSAESQAFVVQNAAQGLIGLAHFRPFARPLAASTGCFLDDLFVDPDARGSGAADALIQAVQREAAIRGWTVVRWITADNNYRARAVYDRLAQQTRWVTYDAPV